MADKPKIRKERMVKTKGQRERKQQHFLKRKKRQVMSASKGTKADTRNPCTRHNPLSSDNNMAGQQMLMNYLTQERMSGLVKH